VRRGDELMGIRVKVPADAREMRRSDSRSFKSSHSQSTSIAFAERVLGLSGSEQ
jgi:hypothetical protein